MRCKSLESVESWDEYTCSISSLTALRRYHMDLKLKRRSSRINGLTRKHKNDIKKIKLWKVPAMYQHGLSLFSNTCLVFGCSLADHFFHWDFHWNYAVMGHNSWATEPKCTLPMLLLKENRGVRWNRGRLQVRERLLECGWLLNRGAYKQTQTWRGAC